MNAQTHCFGLKRATLCSVKGAGEGGAFSAPPEALLDKNVFYNYIIIKTKNNYFTKLSRNYFRLKKDLLVHKH
jgi:hypothetical protein